jgi:predicted nuclease with RNAse H fold
MIVGIDLATKPTNKTGICLLEGSKARVSTLFTDIEIINVCVEHQPTIVAIDAPLGFGDRLCDKLMKGYGAMPLSLPSIFSLAERAVNLVKLINQNVVAEIIEVFPTGSAKILGFYDKNLKRKKQLFEQLCKSKLPNTIDRHCFDALICSITAWLYMNSLTNSVGDSNGVIVIPAKEKKEKAIEEIKLLGLGIS